LLLSQGGEFGFILFGMAAATGVMAQDVSQLLLLIITITMALTPMLERLGNLFERTWTKRRRDDTSMLAMETIDMEGHVVIAGYGNTGERLASALERESITFIAVDTDPRRVLAGRRLKHPVYFGDATRPDVLEAVGATRANAIILTFAHEDEVAQAIGHLHAHYPKTPIFTRASEFSGKTRLESLGAAASTAERDATCMTLLAFTFTALSWPEEEISRVMDKLRNQKVS
jgi:voltage-gated potassium channel Kch